MAPVVKIMSQSGFVYEKNNFVALVEKNEAHTDYHKMMDFIKNCKLSYAMLEAPTIYCEFEGSDFTNYWWNFNSDATYKSIEFIGSIADSHRIKERRKDRVEL
ncbi:hypothetical protein AgCh_002327 [Apium graveolens]